MLVAVLGPDGTGKTTLAKSLAVKLNNFQYVYFGGQNENRRYIYFSAFLSAKKTGKINTLLKYIYIFINDLAYFRLARKQNLVSDRCPVDDYVGSKLKGDRFRSAYYKLKLLILPNPDLVILLVGDSKVIYDRKREIPEDWIFNIISIYKNYLDDSKVNHTVIDTVINNQESTLDLALKEIKCLLDG